MAYLRKAFQAIRGGEKQQDESSGVYFDGANLPDLAAERIACFLDGRDLINLGKTCRFWNEVSRKNIVGKFSSRNGSEDRSVSIPEVLRQNTKSFILNWRKAKSLPLIFK